MKNKILVISASILALILFGYWAFDTLGGNNPVEIEVVDRSPESLVGTTYRGTPQDEKLPQTFQKIEAQKSLNAGTYLHTIYEIEPSGKLDTMIVFVGINKALPVDGFEHKVFEEQQYLLATITGSSWVMPGPKKVQKQLKDFALANNLELSGTFIDKIISKNEVQMIAPIR